MPPWFCFARDNPLCLSFAAVHSTTPATGPPQDLVGLDRTFLEVLTWTFAKDECGLEFFTAAPPTSSDVPWDTVMFHSVQAAAASAPRGESPAVHPDPWFLEHRCSTVTTWTATIHTQKGNSWWPAQEIGSHSSAGLLMEDLSVQRGAQRTIRMWLVLDKENSPKQTALHWDSLQPTKKKSSGNPCSLVWFCTNNLQVQLWESRRYWEFCHQCLWLPPYNLEKPSPKEL